MRGWRYPGANPLLNKNLAKFVSKCDIPGEIYARKHSFPKLKLDLNKTAKGELFQILDTKLLEFTDRMEGYKEGSELNMYIRRMCRLISPDVNAWVYEFNPDNWEEEYYQEQELIDSGDWGKWMQKGGIELPFPEQVET